MTYLVNFIKILSDNYSPEGCYGLHIQSFVVGALVALIIEWLGNWWHESNNKSKETP